LLKSSSVVDKRPLRSGRLPPQALANKRDLLSYSERRPHGAALDRRNGTHDAETSAKKIKQKNAIFAVPTVPPPLKTTSGAASSWGTVANIGGTVTTPCRPAIALSADFGLVGIDMV